MDYLHEMIAEGVRDGMFSFSLTTDGLGVLVYVLQALALYTIAKRRGLKKPWLAWIPIVNVWTLGEISDQYQYLVKGQVKNKRKILLGLLIAISALSLAVLFAALWLIAGALMLSLGALLQEGLTETVLLTLVQEHLGTLLMICLLSVPIGILAAVYAVFFYMALYDVYRSSDPVNSTLYLVLSLVGNVVVDGAYCIFTILCKEKDLGMPPRNQDPEAAQPAFEE